MIKLIEDNNILYAKIIKSSYEKKDTEFFTSNDDELQFGVVTYDKNYKTGAHYHNHLDKPTNQTDEILLIQEGSIRIDFYNDKGVYIKSCEVSTGDIVILYKGGHNMMFYEKTKVYTIKPGVYDENNSKTRIIGANNMELSIEKD